MKKVLLVAVAMVAAMLAMIGTAQTASAYPETTCSVSVSAQTVHEGDNFTVTASATSTTVDQRTAARLAADQFNWQMTFNGEVRTGSGQTFTQTFKAPNVAEVTKLPLTVKSVMADAKATCERTVFITVLPDGTVVTPPGEPGGNLPNTGGPRLLILLAGLGLVAVGAFAVRQSRRRAH